MAKPTKAERAAAGKRARLRMPRADQAETVGGARPDPIELLERQAANRVPALVPIRYGRMAVSPFTFYRGAAAVMARDLGSTGHSGLTVQLCGDAHLSNFGFYFTPERRQAFDVNDFDETHPGPFEWDVKRLAASVAVAGAVIGHSHNAVRSAVLAAVEGYRLEMRRLARLGNLAAWYAHQDIAKLLQQVRSELGSRAVTTGEAFLAKARLRDHVHALAKMCEVVDGRARIRNDPPSIMPLDRILAEFRPGTDPDATQAAVRTLVRTYRRTLRTHHARLLDQYTFTEMGMKVVGVGSVGARAWIILMEGVDSSDPLMLQAKEAQPSVLAPYAKPVQRYSNQGKRVVQGQQLCQATSDIFLGWQRVAGLDGTPRDFYVRQLRDGKGSVVVEDLRPKGFSFYARLCGQTLARGHARSGDRIAIAAYLGGKDTFDRAILDYSRSYAASNECDHHALRAAIDSGSIAAREGV